MSRPEIELRFGGTIELILHAAFGYIGSCFALFATLPVFPLFHGKSLQVLLNQLSSLFCLSLSSSSASSVSFLCNDFPVRS
jgi:hypothetical protein